MIHKSEKINSNYLELLKKCVLVRNLILSSGEKKLLTYKYKEYDEYKNIIRQAKLNLNVDDINTLVEILKLVDFIELIKINDDILVYSNDIDEINIQCVNNKHIYIEIESKCNYIDKIYKTIDMKNVIKKYNIPIKGENYFVKKAENELKETYQNS
jgi:adenylate cyclase class IV